MFIATPHDVLGVGGVGVVCVHILVAVVALVVVGCVVVFFWQYWCYSI